MIVFVGIRVALDLANILGFILNKFYQHCGIVTSVNFYYLFTTVCVCVCVSWHKKSTVTDIVVAVLSK